MVDQIDGLTGIAGKRRNPPRGGVPRQQGTDPAQQDNQGGDYVEISGEARERSSGKKRRSILEYLDEEL